MCYKSSPERRNWGSGLVLIQIFSMLSVEDAVQVARLGADHVGLMVSEKGLRYSVDPGTARRICASVRGAARCVMLPLAHEPAEVLRLARAVEPDVLQIASHEELLPFEAYRRLYGILRSLGFAVVRAVAVGSGGELEKASRYQDAADALLLDTHGEPPDPGLKGFIGGTGRTHDWSLSRRIALSSRIPVILAGGLGPDNVAEAIRAVRPWGVDAATRLDIEGSGGRKDLAKVDLFIKKAREAASLVEGPGGWRSLPRP